MECSPVIIRAARAADALAVEALVEREVHRGTVLPRRFSADAFLVAELDGQVAGTVALTAWSDRVIELGTLIADRSGLGIGRALAEAATRQARERGHDAIVALTSVSGFFERLGFSAVAQTPWAEARRVSTLPTPWLPELGPAVAHKAASSCATCPRLAGCSQALMALRIGQGAEARACA